MKRKIWIERIRFFILGFLLALGMMILTGANQSIYYSSRYQIASWDISMDKGKASYGAFILDTFTGETRIAYNATYGNPKHFKVKENHLKTPFYSTPLSKKTTGIKK